MKYKAEADIYIHGGTQKDFYSKDEVISCHCPLCDFDKYDEIYRERGNLGIVECKNCGLIYANPRLKSPEQVYWGDAQKYFDEARLIFLNKKPHHRDRNYADELRKIKRHKSSGKLLDIGCSMGFFLRKAREFGFEAEGVEPSGSLSQLGTKYFNLKIINSLFEEAQLQSESFDVITMIDVFEHITNPKVMLKEAHRVLKTDGVVCIKVPNGNYNKLKLKLAKLTNRTENFDLFDSYEHVVHYTRKTMKKMVDQTGFKVKKLYIPLPIHIPVWHLYVGHYYQYPSPFRLDWKRIMLRNAFYRIGKIENFGRFNISFAPDLMFILEKK